MKSAIDIFVQLGKRLERFGNDETSSEAIRQAVSANGWFSVREIAYAVEAIRSQMLQHDKLERWLSVYALNPRTPKRVAVVMAGNIPLVGFYDLLCVIAGGHRAVVKPSAKDTALMLYVVSLLREIEPEIPVNVIDDEGLLSSVPDAVIATGSDNAVRFFRSHFADIPMLLRGSRHSVAVLAGDETEEELSGLESDMLLYSGLGCRNVSMLFVPRGTELKFVSSEVNPKYRNNYLQAKAMLTMRGTAFADAGSTLFVPDRDFPAYLSAISVAEYDEIDEVTDWIALHDNELQCVVTHCVNHPRSVPFGCSQRPRLEDCPDDVDVMQFLAEL